MAAKKKKAAAPAPAKKDNRVTTDEWPEGKPLDEALEPGGKYRDERGNFIDAEGNVFGEDGEE
jgi:hypothetical protein